MKKRWISVFLTVALMVLNISSSFAFAAESEVTVVEDESEPVEADYAITDVYLYGKYADVKYEAKANCTILVALFNEAGTKMYTSAKKMVRKNGRLAELEFEVEIPDKCIVKVFILEAGTNIPLAEVYTCSYPEDNMDFGDYEEIAPFDETAHGEVVKSGSCGESVEWKFYEDGMLYIFGRGKMEDYATQHDWFGTGVDKAPWNSYSPLGVNSVYVEQGVTSIGTAAFYGISNLSSVQIANSVETIFSDAFGNCKKLTNIQLSPRVQNLGSAAFANCVSPSAVELSENLTAIYSGVFENCKSLEFLELPEGVKEIGWSAFENCTALEALDLPEKLDYIGPYAFAGCTSLRNIEIPEGVEIVLYNTFEDCTGLKRVVIPDGVTEIGEYAFRNCTSLESITIPESVKTIGLYAFYNSLWLKNQIQKNTYVIVNDILIDGSAVTGDAVIPDGVRTINYDAFYKNNNITSVKMPDSVVRIEEDAFNRCTNLTSVAFSNQLSVIENYAFNNCSKLTEVTLPDTVTSLEFGAFYYCTDLTTITLPANLKYIDDYMFSGCTSLGAITLPDSVEYIGKESFSGCKSLMEIDIPDTVTKILENVFIGCTNLVHTNIPKGITEIPENLFKGCTNLSEIEFHNGIKSLGKNCMAETKWLSDRKTENPLVIINNIVYDGTAVSGDAVIPEGVTGISQYAFLKNNNLKSVKMADSVSSVGVCAFYDCAYLEEVELSDNIRSIGSEAFYSCERLETIVIPEHVSGIHGRVFDKTKWLDNKKADNPYVVINGLLYDVSSSAGSTPVVPDGVTAIGAYAFDELYVTSVTLPASVTEIAPSFLANRSYYAQYSTDVIVADSMTLMEAVGKAVDAIYNYGITIYGPEGSAAQAYAAKEKIPFSYSDKSYVHIKWPVPLAPAQTVALSDAEVTGSAVTGDAVVDNDTTGDAVIDDAESENIRILYNHPVIDRMYLFVVVKDADAKELLASTNLIYIDMLTADEKGELEFNYIADLDEPGVWEIIENPNTGIEFGDTDENGKIDLTDANNVLKIALGIVGYGERYGYIADVDGDKRGTLEDANLVLKMALGIEE